MDQKNRLSSLGQGSSHVLTGTKCKKGNRCNAELVPNVITRITTLG